MRCRHVQPVPTGIHWWMPALRFYLCTVRFCVLALVVFHVHVRTLLIHLILAWLWSPLLPAICSLLCLLTFSLGSPAARRILEDLGTLLKPIGAGDFQSPVITHMFCEDVPVVTVYEFCQFAFILLRDYQVDSCHVEESVQYCKKENCQVAMKLILVTFHSLLKCLIAPWCYLGTVALHVTRIFI